MNWCFIERVLYRIRQIFLCIRFTASYVLQQEIWILMIQSRNIIGCNYLLYFLLSMLVNFFEYLTTHSKLIEKYLSIILFACYKAIRTYLLINVLDLTDGLFRDWLNIFKTTFVLNYDNTTFFVKLQMKNTYKENYNNSMNMYILENYVKFIRLYLYLRFMWPSENNIT